MATRSTSPTPLRARMTGLLAIVSILAGACMPAAARSLVTLDVIDRDSGAWLAPTPHRGDRWIAGVPGHRYAVRLTNTSSARVLVVLSVDGVNAVTGQTASPSQAGYVLEPWQSTEVAGWRKSMDDIAQFVFTDLPDSYAARTGRPFDVGVIGIAVFEERRYRPLPLPTAPPIAQSSSKADRVNVTGNRAGAGARAESAAAAPTAAAADAAAPAQRMGTGHGAREWAPTSRTTFVRATTHAAQISSLRYDDVENLVSRGVLPRWPHPRRDARPDAFPAGFVADPPG